jgi:transglutaminase-like putative cysteine protease
VEFVLVALAAKLFYRRNNRDDVHVFVLSFLLVLAAAALGGSALFAPAFLAYVLAATWALVLFHLRREMEENYLVKHSAQAPSQKVGVARILASRRVVGGSFFAATGAVAACVALGAFATFAFVPRLGAGSVLGAARASANAVGFSDDVTLGRHGTLSTENGSVALRATIPRLAALPTQDARDRAASELYFRGTVYDAYAGGHWTRSRAPALRTVLGELDRRVVVHEGAHAAGSLPMPATAAEVAAAHAAAPPLEADPELDRQVIDVVSLAAPVAFAVDRPVAFELEVPAAGAPSALQLAPRWSGEVALRIAPPGSAPVAELGDDARAELRAPPAARYVAYSRRAPEAPSHAPSALSAEAQAAYLQLPAGLSPRVVELARTLTAGGVAPAQAVEAVVRWLRDTHRYTLRLPQPTPDVDPVESFLFDTPEGHCEYFATAAALLLRAAGVPARYVNGYLGGEWNDVGHYVAVRDNRAHSWVEAFMPGRGWVRVDATPPLPTAARAGSIGQFLDALDFKWSRWVVGYDLSRQLALGRRVARAVGLEGGDSTPNGAPRRSLAWLAIGALGLAVAAALLAASRIWRRRAPRRGLARPHRAASVPVQRVYERALDRLARQGWPRGRTETPREYAARFAAGGLPGSDLLVELTDVYTAARFGGRSVEPEVLRRLARGVSDLGRALPAHGP